MSLRLQDFRRHLLSAANDRGIVLSPEDVKLIEKSGHNSHLRRWVELNLQPTRLLSLEEKSRSPSGRQDATKRSGLQEGPQASASLPPNYELQATIERLETSTEIIKCQSGLREAQMTVLNELETRETDVSRNVAQHLHQNGIHKRTEAQQLNLEIQKCRRQLLENVSNAHFRAEKICEFLPTMVNNLLNHQDRLLEELERDLPMGTERSATYDTDLKRSKNLTDILHKFTVEELHDRLDRIYLQSLSTKLETSVSEGPHNEGLVQQLEKDLSSLHCEIPDVASMAISQQYTVPINKLLNEIEHEAQRATERNVQLIECRLETLIRTLEDVAAVLLEYQSYRTACDTMYKHAAGVELSSIYSEDKTIPCSKIAPANLSLLQHFGVLTNPDIDHTDIQTKLRGKAEKTRELTLRSSNFNEQVIEDALTKGETSLEPLRRLEGFTEEIQGLIGLQDLDKRLSKLKAKVENLNLAETNQQTAALQQLLQ